MSANPPICEKCGSVLIDPSTHRCPVDVLAQEEEIARQRAALDTQLRSGMVMVGNTNDIQHRLATKSSAKDVLIDVLRTELTRVNERYDALLREYITVTRVLRGPDVQVDNTEFASSDQADERAAREMPQPADLYEPPEPSLLEIEGARDLFVP